MSLPDFTTQFELFSTTGLSGTLFAEQDRYRLKEKMRHRNAIEGTQSELVRAHGLRHARYRGLTKAKLQNYFIGAACNLKLWLRRLNWQIEQSAANATL